MTKVLDIQEKLADRKRSRDLLRIMGHIDAIEKDMDVNPRKYIELSHDEINRLHQLMDDIKRIIYRAKRPYLTTEVCAVLTPDYVRWRKALDDIEELLATRNEK